MAACLVAKPSGLLQPRLEFRTVQTAARTVLRIAEGGMAIPAIVDEHNSVIWDYPGGDIRSEPGRGALARLRALAQEEPR